MRTDALVVGATSISVTQTDGRGPCIVLCHANSSSSRGFRRQLDGPLGEEFRLVAIDFAGHGRSSRAADPADAYGLRGHARVVVDVARRLELSNAVFVGWSLGGHVVLEASAALPGAAGFAIFGAPPIGFPPAMGEAFLPCPSLGVAFAEDPTDAEIRAFQEAVLAPGAEVPDAFREDFVRADGRARGALGASIASGGYTNEVEIVAGLSRPLAILHGARDQIVNGAYYERLSIPRLWRGAVQVIPGAGHAPHWENAAAFDLLLGAFARECASLATR